MTYPTVYVGKHTQLTRRSKLLREVIWKEVEIVAGKMGSEDIPRVALALREIHHKYRATKHNASELLREYYYLDPFRNPSTGELLADSNSATSLQLRVEDIPWETIPPDLMERCLDDNFDLCITEELRSFLGFSSQPPAPLETNYAKYPYTKDFVERTDPNVVRVRVTNDRKREFRYYIWDEETQTHKQVRVKGRQWHVKYDYSYHEVDWVIDNLSSEEFCKSKFGVDTLTVNSTLCTIARTGMKSEKYFFTNLFNELQRENPDRGYLTKMRRDYVKEQVLTLNGQDLSDTSKIWRMVEDEHS